MIPMISTILSQDERSPKCPSAQVRKFPIAQAPKYPSAQVPKCPSS